MITQQNIDQVLNGLVTYKWAVVPQFIPEDLRQQLRREAELLLSDKNFRPAGIGRGTAFQENHNIRSDLIYWLDATALSPAQAMVMRLFNDLRLTLNRELYVGLNEFEAHFAVYPKGAAYARHIDQHRSSDARVVSCALYLNSAWQESDGGILRMFDKNNPAHVVKEVTPTGGTLVCFLSHEVPHEVLPPVRARYSLTGWMRR